MNLFVSGFLVLGLVAEHSYLISEHHIELVAERHVLDLLLPWQWNFFPPKVQCDLFEMPHFPPQHHWRDFQVELEQHTVI